MEKIPDAGKDEIIEFVIRNINDYPALEYGFKTRMSAHLKNESVENQRKIIEDFIDYLRNPQTGNRYNFPNNSAIVWGIAGARKLNYVPVFLLDCGNAIWGTVFSDKSDPEQLRLLLVNDVRLDMKQTAQKQSAYVKNETFFTRFINFFSSLFRSIASFFKNSNPEVTLTSKPNPPEPPAQEKKLDVEDSSVPHKPTAGEKAINSVKKVLVNPTSVKPSKIFPSRTSIFNRFKKPPKPD